MRAATSSLKREINVSLLGVLLVLLHVSQDIILKGIDQKAIDLG